MQMEDRIALNNELHARPPMRLEGPMRCSHIVILNQNSEGYGLEFSDLCDKYNQPSPATDARYHMVDIGSCRVKWESHTEAESYTMLVPGNSQPYFEKSALSYMPEAIQKSLLDAMFVGIHIEVIPSKELGEDYGYKKSQSLLGVDSIIGGWVADHNAVVWASFRLDSEGFIRFVIVDVSLSVGMLARLVHRLLEIESYWTMALMALPMARQSMSQLNLFEPELDYVMARLAANPDEDAQKELLVAITDLAARIEHMVSSTAFRFSAARAYEGIARSRMAELRENKLEGHERISTFLDKRITPAMRTCEAAERRANELAVRVARAAGLLDTMVDMVRQRQNQSILKSMEQRAGMQVHLQQAVEGFSIIAISYYGVNLVGYILKAIHKLGLGLGLNIEVLTGISVPIMLTLSFISVRMIRRAVNKKTGQ
jgi:uncharacterized membrane-anchored protein